MVKDMAAQLGVRANPDLYWYCLPGILALGWRHDVHIFGMNVAGLSKNQPSVDVHLRKCWESQVCSRSEYMWRCLQGNAAYPRLCSCLRLKTQDLRSTLLRFALRYSLAPEWEAVVELSTCKCKVTYWEDCWSARCSNFQKGETSQRHLEWKDRNIICCS